MSKVCLLVTGNCYKLFLELALSFLHAWPTDSLACLHCALNSKGDHQYCGKRESSFLLSCFLMTVSTGNSEAEWIITVGHRPNSEPNLPMAGQFNKLADMVTGLFVHARWWMWLKQAGVAIAQ